MSQIDCPALCPHNPFGFAAYPEFKRVEERWFEKAAKRTKTKDLRLLKTSEGVDMAAFREWAEVQHVMTTLLGRGPLTTNTPLDQWADDPAASLSNDERFMTRCRAGTRATVIEIQRAQGANCCVAIDVFAPEKGEFVVFQPSIAQAPRFSRHLGWFTWYPHFAASLSSTMQLVPHHWFPWKAEVLGELKNRQNQDATITVHRFLQENFLQSIHLLGTIIEEWEQPKEPVDGPAPHYAAVYSVQASLATIQDQFDSIAACAPWMVIPNHPLHGKCHGEYRFRIGAADLGRGEYEGYIGRDQDQPNELTIGMFSLYEKILLYHCNCKSAFDLGRKLLEDHFSGALVFLYEDILDRAAILRREPAFSVEPLPFAPVKGPCRAAPYDPSRPPDRVDPAVDALRQLIRDHHARTFQGFIDSPHFFLEMQTPREAAQSEAGRQEVIQLMKVTLYELDIRNRQFQLDLNIDEILEQLNMQALSSGSIP